MEAAIGTIAVMAVLVVIGIAVSAFAEEILTGALIVVILGVFAGIVAIALLVGSYFGPVAGGIVGFILLFMLYIIASG